MQFILYCDWSYLSIGHSNAFLFFIRRIVNILSMFTFSGSWKEKQFKPYNFDAQGIIPTSGHLHPLMKVRAQFRQIFLEMGSVEKFQNWFLYGVIPFILWGQFSCNEEDEDYKLLRSGWSFLRFTEMPTNNFVESSFWNFDSLFQPQQHPARDAHDTFFMAG